MEPLSVEIVDLANQALWDRWVSGYEHASIFHSAAWASVLRRSYGYDPAALLLQRGGRCVAVVPVMEVRSRLTGTHGASMPFSDVCPLLMEDPLELPAILEALTRYGFDQQWKYFELRCKLPDPASAQVQQYYHHTVDLGSGEEELARRLHPATRRNVRKAERTEELSVEFTTSLRSLRQFYGLHCRNRRSKGLPPQPFSFFRNIHRFILGAGLGVVVQATLRGRVIASNIYLHYGRNAIYKYGASSHRHLGLRPNNLIMWEAIKWYARRGYSSLSLGRTSPTDWGLVRFKAGWGAGVEEIGYYRLAPEGPPRIASGNGGTGSAMASIFRKLPIPILRLVGAMFYRDFG